MITISLRIRLILILLLTTISIFAQTSLPNTESFFESLLQKEVIDSEGEKYKQTVEINPSLGILYIKTSHSKSDTVSIAFCSIAGVTEDWEKQVLSIHQINGDKTDISMLLGTVRNVSGRMILEIRKAAKTAFSYCQSNRMTNPSARSFVSAAVFEELIRMNIDESLASQILEDKALFVKKCNICSGSQKAFDNYVKYYELNGELKTDIPSIRSEILKDRLTALEALVTRSVETYFTLHGYSDQEIESIREMLKNERQRSMDMTNGGSCASCDGACKLSGTK